MDVDINMLVRQLLRHKFTTNMTEAMGIAEQIASRVKAQTEEDRQFCQLLIAALNPQEIMTIGSSQSSQEISALKQEIEALKIKIHGLETRPAPRAQPASSSSTNSPQEPAAETPKKIVGVGYGEARKEYDVNSVSVEKMFYFGNKR